MGNKLKKSYLADGEEGCLIAQTLDLPGGISQGKTTAAVLGNTSEAILNAFLEQEA